MSGLAVDVRRRLMALAYGGAGREARERRRVLLRLWRDRPWWPCPEGWLVDLRRVRAAARVRDPARALQALVDLGYVEILPASSSPDPSKYARLRLPEPRSRVWSPQVGDEGLPDGMSWWWTRRVSFVDVADCVVLYVRPYGGMPDRVVRVRLSTWRRFACRVSTWSSHSEPELAHALP